MDDSRRELKAIQDYLRQKAPRKYDERPIYYVYTHENTDPTRGDLGCRYIGKGKGKRAYIMNRKGNFLWMRAFTDNQPEITFVVENVDEETAFEIEKWMITAAKAVGIDLCNLTEGGEGLGGYHHLETTKQKISKSHIGKTMPEESVRKISAKKRGVHLKEEHKIKISIALTGRPGRPHSEKTKKHLSEIQMGEKNHNFGKKKTPETLEKMRNAKLGKCLPDETKEKIRQTLMGSKRSMAAREKTSATLRATWARKKNKIETLNEK